MQHLDLFSGIGGMSLGLEAAGMETVGFVEWDEYCQKILKQHWPDAPVYRDIKEVKGDEFGAVDLISGGFPCQGFSFAGKRKGKDDDRYLWPEMFRLIKTIRPAWVLGENVPGIISLALDTVLSDLESEGYSCRTFVLPAVSVDAPHRRDRVWIVGHSQHARYYAPKVTSSIKKGGRSSEAGEAKASQFERPDQQYETMADTEGAGLHKFQLRETNINNDSADVADTEGQRVQRNGSTGEQKPKAHGGAGLSLCESSGGGGAIWPAEPGMGRVANGVPGRTHRIKALGNAVAPPLVEQIGRLIMQFEESICN